jgi:hypothetical protein
MELSRVDEGVNLVFRSRTEAFEADLDDVTHDIFPDGAIDLMDDPLDRYRSLMEQCKQLHFQYRPGREVQATWEAHLQSGALHFL